MLKTCSVLSLVRCGAVERGTRRGLAMWIGEGERELSQFSIAGDDCPSDLRTHGRRMRRDVEGGCWVL
jgi:hypothetical protein